MKDLKKTKFNFYIFFNILITIVNIAIVIILAIFVANKIWAIVYSLLSILMFNGGFAFWIVNSNKRTTKSKLTWLLLFLIFPFFAFFIFLFWGRTPFKYKSKKNYIKTEKKYINLYNYSLYNDLMSIKGQTLASNFLTLVRYNYNTCQEPVFTKNHITIINKNTAMFKNLFDSIEKSKKFVFIQYYIISEGFYLNTLIALLLRKAKEGVRVYILFDRVGSLKIFSKQLIQRLCQEKNIEIAFFESKNDYKIRSTTNFRSHRKMLIVDNEICIYGGSNLGDEYLSMREDYANWHDLNFSIEGPLVQRMLFSFFSDWENQGNEALVKQLALWKHVDPSKKLTISFYKLKRQLFSRAKKIIAENIEWKPMQERDLFKHLKNENIIKEFPKQEFKINEHEENTDHNLVSFINTGPRNYTDFLTEQIISSISRANKSIRIITPYFNPNDEIFTAIRSAAASGIKVDIIVPGVKNNQWFLLYMNRMNYWKIMRSNVTFHEYNGFVHTKLILVDDRISLIGTFNMDLRSLNSNYESMLIIYNEEINKQLTNYSKELLKNSSKINRTYLKNKQNIFGNFVTYLLRLIQPLL